MINPLNTLAECELALGSSQLLPRKTSPLPHTCFMFCRGQFFAQAFLLSPPCSLLELQRQRGLTKKIGSRRQMKPYNVTSNHGRDSTQVPRSITGAEIQGHQTPWKLWIYFSGHMEYPTRYVTAPITKNYLVQMCSCGETVV